MGLPRRSWLPAMVIVVIGPLFFGCSSGQDKSSQGSLSVKLVASRPFIASDPMPQLVAARVTVSGIEARKSDGSWVPRESDPEATLDLVALDAEGVSLPSHLLPEGQYSALQLRFSRVDFRLGNGAEIELPAPPTGWVVRIPADFAVVNDRATAVTLKLDPGVSFKFGGGHFEFDPDIQFDGVVRLGTPPRRQALARGPREGRVMRDVVEQHEARNGVGLHVEDAQAARAHVQAIAVTPKLDPQER